MRSHTRRRRQLSLGIFDPSPPPDLDTLTPPPVSRVGFPITPITYPDAEPAGRLIWFSPAGSWNPATGSLWSGADSYSGVFDVGLVVGSWRLEIERLAEC